MKGFFRAMARRPASKVATGGGVRVINFPVRNLAITVAGASGVGYGTAVLGDLPEGFLNVLGTAARLQFQTSDADVQAAFDGDFSVGTTPTADATLSSTDANLIASTALGAATAKVSPVVTGTGAPLSALLDNSDGSLEVNLNLIVDDANISGDAIFYANGVLTVAVLVLGDD